ncbi:hypothetical protein F25303_12325 [Fusarium sp. NRRL 25303]|nr:hypothetical protein F25303_12325 [Fusarium sp. NRRL 25303]
MLSSEGHIEDSDASDRRPVVARASESWGAARIEGSRVDEEDCMFLSSSSSSVQTLSGCQSPSNSRITHARRVAWDSQRGKHLEFSRGLDDVEQRGDTVANAANSKGMAERQAVTETKDDQVREVDSVRRRSVQR